MHRATSYGVGLMTGLLERRSLSRRRRAVVRSVLRRLRWAALSPRHPTLRFPSASAGTDQGGLLVASKAVRKSETGSSPAGSPSSPDRGGAEPARWAFRSHRRIFGTGAVRQLDIAHTPPMLLSLDSEGVNAYHLPNFVRKGQAHGTSKSSCFDWDDASGLLCTAYKKRSESRPRDASGISRQSRRWLPACHSRNARTMRGSVWVHSDVACEPSIRLSAGLGALQIGVWMRVRPCPLPFASSSVGPF